MRQDYACLQTATVIHWPHEDKCYSFAMVDDEDKKTESRTMDYRPVACDDLCDQYQP
jgi:hypothetical protein